jgi:hypothetical protein
MQPFRFVLVDAPSGTLVLGVAVFEEGRRVGQIIAELVDAKEMLIPGKDLAFVAIDKRTKLQL